MYLLHLRCSQAVFSHETALFFHDLTDREPLKYTITVRTGYNPSRLQVILHTMVWNTVSIITPEIHIRNLNGRIKQ